MEAHQYELLFGHASHEPVNKNKKELMIVMYTSLIYCAKAIGLAIKFMRNISIFHKSRFISVLLPTRTFYLKVMCLGKLSQKIVYAFHTIQVGLKTMVF